jgi:hypothetical protein
MTAKIKMAKFFWDKAPGLNADIDRHRSKEKELADRISDLETQDQSDPMVTVVLRTLRHIMCQLQQSKADVVNKIGRGK